jgi:hypothetical protein
MKIGKILVGGLLASSSIGNTGNTFVKIDHPHGLVKAFEVKDNLSYYNKLVEAQPQELKELKTADQRLMDNYGGIRQISPISCPGCEGGC